MILSRGLDTNGQNSRFVRAAERWGRHPEILRVMAVGNYDPANVVGRFEEAAEKLGGLTIRSAHKAEAYFEFPRDILWDRSTENEVRRLAHQADVIHLNNSDRAYRELRLKKPALLHHHGSLFRNNPGHMLAGAKARRFVQAVSTHDLLRYSDELTWLPTAYDIDALREFGNAHRRAPDGRIRVVSAPTNRGWKSTDLLIATVKKLQKTLPVDLVLIENKTWAECMTIKATADIYFDQVILGYGCNAVEAWGMGIPVIAGADPWTLDRMRQDFPLPFYEATEQTIGEAIEALCDPKVRKEYAKKGTTHVETWHAERPALTKLVELYMRAIAEHRVAPTATLPRPAPGKSWGQMAEEAKAARRAARLKVPA